ncbi:uncharacterized protein LOC121239825 isoform X2 [Juglans microcarpa x Juglans regia]|uniref:uncharacterized protein LOC121239825 isoform X2 n=1 Tax=Juglans microcarpa x Juglans regia TaxID=2249226 RepID=UPI001B7E8D95|nr:uncharacterized protein LOC121239825 isoform X2 [Juglans microcarpa x Juglans regia]
MVAGEMVESDICPAEDAVQSFLEYLVEQMLPAKSFLQGTPSQSLQQSVAKQLHAIVLLYNYYLRKRHPQLEVLGFEAFCKLVVILKPALLAHMKLMQRSDDTELDDLEKQLSVTERTIMEACDISTKLDASNDVPNIEGWPMSKVSVLLFDYKKENCFLLFSSITQGVWSVIEKDVDISNLNSEGQVEAKQMNRKRRLIRKPSKEDPNVNESALLQLAYLAVKEATGINQTELVVSESHVVCSLSKEKTALRFYIMYCTQSVNEEGFQVPIKDALESLQGPLVRKSSSRWMVTPVVKYFHMLPYAGIVSTWLSREVASGLQDARVGGGNSNLNGPDRTENDLRVGKGNSNLNSPDRTEKLCIPEIHKSGNSPHIDDGLVGIFCNETKSNDTESLEEKNKNNGEKCKKIADTIQVDNHQENTSNFRESDLNGSTSNIEVKDEMEDSMVRPGITECGGKQNADGNRTYDNMLTAQDVIGDHDLVTCQSNSINLYKLQNTIASKQSDLSPSALRVLLRKRDELSLQLRKIEDEIAQCDKQIQKILNGTG